jgi:hypothetical protein
MKVKKKMFMKFQNIIGVKDSNFRWNDNSGWKAETLIQYAKEQKLEPFKLYFSNIDIGFPPFKINDLYDFISHCQRVNNCDLKYPVIMGESGAILDGWHRIAKAILMGKKYIYAVRFIINPEMDLEPDKETAK